MAAKHTSLKHKEQSDTTNIVVAIVGRTEEKTAVCSVMHTPCRSIRHKKNVHIVNPYFVPTSSINKALNGPSTEVNVTIMVSSASDIPFTPDAALYKLAKLMKRGATVYMYNGGFHHSKIMMVDDLFCTVGTAKPEQPQPPLRLRDERFHLQQRRQRRN